MSKVNLFAHVEDTYYDAVKAASTLSGLSLRSVIEAMIADRMGVIHPDQRRARSAWTQYRKTARS